MAEKKKRTECGPVIACGAATVSLSHDPNDPTSIDKLAEAVKRFMRNEGGTKKATNNRESETPASYPVKRHAI